MNAFKRRGRLHRQITVRVALALTVVMVCFLAFDYRVQRAALVADLGARMAQEMQLLRLALRDVKGPDGIQSLIGEHCSEMKHHGKLGHTLSLVSRDRRVLAAAHAATAEMIGGVIDLERVLGGLEKVLVQETSVGGQRVLVVAVPTFQTTDGLPIGALFYAETLTDVESLSYELLRSRLWLTVCLLLATSVVVWLVVRRKVMEPLNALIAHEGELARGDLDTWKEHPETNNELSELHDIFNYVIEKLRRKQQEDHLLAEESAQKRIAQEAYDET